MPDRFRARTPLAHLGLAARAGERGGAGVVLGEEPLRSQAALRGDGSDAAFAGAVERVTRVTPPIAPNTVAGPEDLANGVRILWLGPDEWLVVGIDDADLAARLDAALAGQHAAVADVSDSRAVIGLAGPAARDVLAKGCPLDLHPRVFGPGRCAQSHLAKAHVLLHQLGSEPRFEIYVHRSFADYLWRWLEDAAAEYGLAIPT